MVAVVVERELCCNTTLNLLTVVFAARVPFTVLVCTVSIRSGNMVFEKIMSYEPELILLVFSSLTLKVKMHVLPCIPCVGLSKPITKVVSALTTSAVSDIAATVDRITASNNELN